MCGHRSSMAWNCPLTRNTATSLDATVTTVLPPSGTALAFPTVTRWPTPGPLPRTPMSDRAAPGYCTRRERVGGEPMLEVEVKYRAADRPAVLARLRGLGAAPAGE